MKKRGLVAGAPLALLSLLAAGALLNGQRSVGPSRGDQAFASETERRDWERVIQAEHVDRPLRALEFLRLHPAGSKVAEAHYVIADQAFAAGRYAEFRQHAESALAAISGWETRDDPEKVRWLQLLAQLAFFNAESGEAERALDRADHLLEVLKTGPPPQNLTPSQWSEHRLQLSSAAFYAAGRAWLGKAAASPQDVSSTALERAVENLRAALLDNPADAYAAYRLGEACRIQGDLNSARDNFALAVAIGGPVLEPARRQLGAVLPPGTKPEAVSELVEGQRSALEKRLRETPRSLVAMPDGAPHPIFWWDQAPARVREESVPPGPFSNIRLSDYAGPEACRPCHADKYEAWSRHSHRWMNAEADAQTVKGDFSNTATIDYRGGKASFELRDGAYWMRLQRGASKRVYRIYRTIGSRFFQYYVGRLVVGPEPASHPVRDIDHVLPFGYWIDQAEWVPIVHIDQEAPDSERVDPFAGPATIQYDYSCSACHTTRPIGDWMLRTDGRLRLAQFSPRELSFWIAAYLKETHPDLVDRDRPASAFSLSEVRRVLDIDINSLPAKGNTVVLGVSCEACHNGARKHVELSRERETSQRPLFFPSSPDLFIRTEEPAVRIWGRTPRNLNWICARCHSGSRPHFAGGMDTWNSTEYSDAARGFCYQAASDTEAGRPTLTCVTCHDPHHTIGKKWSRPPDLDDAKCLNCHQRFGPDAERSKHTRHAVGSEGSRCMNCHMPRINEGMQDVVRTHRIFNPTNAAMIEANQPNACNLCHLDKPVDWTLGYLKQWYGRSYDEAKLQANYPRRSDPVGLGWLQSPHESTRLVAAEALGRSGARWALAGLVETLDDPYLLNRQFAAQAVQRLLAVDLTERFGYRFPQFQDERREPLRKIRAYLKNLDVPPESQ